MSKKKVLTRWTGLPRNFQVEDYEGFVYLIVNTLTDKKYIGRKYFWSITKKKVKGQKRRIVTKKESDWKYYKSSCTELKENIEEFGKKNFKFKIIHLLTTRGMTNYTETKEQFTRDVLYSVLPDGEYEYYNSNILSRYYRLRTKKDECTRL